MMTEEDILPRELTNNIPRRGKWTAEEERYTEKIICDFEHGTLDVPEGTTLRTLLAKVLNCDPMRITKKYTGNSSIGKRTFVPLVRTPENAIFMDMSQQELRELRAIWVNKLILMEQWNNRKMNLMKAHMGLGGPYDPSGSNPHGRFDPPGSGNMLTCPTPQAAMLLQRQASGVHDYNLSLSDLNNFTHLHSMNSMNAMSLPLPMGMNGMNGLNGMNGPSGMNSSNSANGLPDMNGLNGMNGMNNMSNLDSSLEAFQEVSLRLSLEPYVSAPSEMDFIIKWLRTLNIVVTSGRTLSPADLEHSLSARSISLPALVAIYRSNCVAEHTRLRQLHETIEAYLRQIGITFPITDNNNKSILPEVLSAKPTSSNGNNGASTSATESNTTSVKSSLTSSDGLVNPVSSPKSNANERATPLPGVTSINTEGTADSTGAIFTENSPLLLSRDTLSAKPLNNTTMSADKNITTSNNNVSKNTSAGAVPFIPAHLQHHFATSKQSVAPLPVPTTTTSNNNTNTALTTHLSSLFGTKYNLLPYAPEPGSEALYQAEQQALAFSEQQARAHAAAQAQAKALAESYQYPTAKETPKVAELNRASSSGTEISGIGEGGEGDADDHLMLYHKALVQSLAAGRKQKRSAAATAKSHSAAILSSNPNNQTNHSSNSSNSVAGNNSGNSGTSASNAMNSAASFAANQRDVNSAKSTAMVPAGPLQPQKRRKLAEYTDMFNRAAYPNNYVPYPHMSPSLNNASAAYMEQQMQLLGNAGGEDANNPNNPYGSGYNNRLYPNSMDYAAMYARMPGFSGAVDPNLSAMYANMLNRNVPAGSNPTDGNTSTAVNPLSSVLANSSNTSNNPTNANTSTHATGTNTNTTGTTATLQLGTQPNTADPSAHTMAALAQAYEAAQRRSSGIPYLPTSMPGSAHFNAQAAAQAMAHSASVSGLTNPNSNQSKPSSSAPSNAMNVQPHPATLASAPTNTTTSSNTTNTNTMPNAATGLPMQSPFSPELLAMYMQQMYSTWPYPGMSAVPGGNLNTNLNNNMNNMNNGLSNGVGNNGSSNNINGNNNMSNAQTQLQHAQMLHFAESLHHAALANSNRHNNEMLQQQQQQQLQQMQQQRANSNPQPSANHNSSSSGTNSNNNTSSNNTGNTASARAYAEMHMAQERQVPTYSTDPNNHSGTSIATKNMHLMGPLGPKVTLDEYLKSMQKHGYPYNTQGQSAAARAEGRINHANATAAANAALLNNKSSIHNGSQGMQLNANREIYTNLPYMAGQNYYSDSVNASLAGTKGSHTDKSPSATSTGSGNNAESTVNNATAESHETDREGKEKGHSAAAEALLTLLKK